jgi:hypothetical protein
MRLQMIIGDIEHNAEALILRAAREAGLTQVVATALWWAVKYGFADECANGGRNIAANLLSSLTEDFQENITSPDVVVEDMVGGGLSIEPQTKAEKAEVATFLSNTEGTAI